jgi:Flp pilus assembly CpaE family ATPase
VVTAVSTPLIESRIIRAFIQAELNIAERLFDLNNFVNDDSKEVILILTPDQKSKREIRANWIVGIGTLTDERWKNFKPMMIISPEEVDLLPALLFEKMNEVNRMDIVVGATEILFLGSKGSPGTSTLAWNYAGELARSGQRVLLAEENINGAEGAIFFGFDDQSISTSAFGAITIRPNYDLLCKPLVRSKMEITTPEKWADLRKKCQERFSQIVIDGGVFELENNSSLQSYFLNRAEKIFLVGQDDIFSLLRLKLIVDQVLDLNNEANISIVVNKSQANSKTKSQIKNQIVGPRELELCFLPRADQLFTECVRDGLLISEVKGSKAASISSLIKGLASYSGTSMKGDSVG